MEVNMLTGRNRQRGFTYIGLLIVISISGIAMAGVGIVWHLDTLREQEKELLFAGEAYRVAIRNYYESSPNSIKQFPLSLDDLLLDKRFPTIKRHIRKLYLDPMMPDKNWGLVMQQGKIIGVYSKSTLAPIKKTGFQSPYETFGSVKEYREWQFVYVPSSNLIPNNPISGP